MNFWGELILGITVLICIIWGAKAGLEAAVNDFLTRTSLEAA